MAEMLVGPALERLRVELTGYCYRMVGSPFEAEDAVQEAFARAWRNPATVRLRSSVGSYLGLRDHDQRLPGHAGGAQRRASLIAEFLTTDPAPTLMPIARHPVPDEGL